MSFLENREDKNGPADFSSCIEMKKGGRISRSLSAFVKAWIRPHNKAGIGFESGAYILVCEHFKPIPNAVRGA
ncbi:uncharacterized protein Dvar_11800 [Desulfosarcina variabilis str. Montpellier]